MLSLVPVALLAAVVATQRSPAVTPPMLTEIARIKLKDGTELVVLRDPMTPASALGPFLPPGLATRKVNPPIGFFCLSAELRPPSGQPLCIWSQVRHVYNPGELDEYEVLDALVLPDGRIALAMVTPFSTIVVMDLSVTAPVRHAALAGSEWSQLGAAIPNKPGRIKAKLTFNGKNNTVGVTVSDTVSDSVKNTSFEQQAGKWEFAPVPK
jgi:hypothetical protein